MAEAEEICRGKKVGECIVVHHCTQETHIGEMMGLMRQVVQQIYGNGHEGLSTTVPAQTVRIDNLAVQVKDLSTNVSALIKFMDQTSGGEAVREKVKLSGTAWAAIISSAIMGGAAIVLTLIQLILNL